MLSPPYIWSYGPDTIIRELESYRLVEYVVSDGFPRPTHFARPTSRKPSLVEVGGSASKLLNCGVVLDLFVSLDVSERDLVSQFTHNRLSR